MRLGSVRVSSGFVAGAILTALFVGAAALSYAW